MTIQELLRQHGTLLDFEPCRGFAAGEHKQAVADFVGGLQGVNAVVHRLLLPLKDVQLRSLRLLDSGAPPQVGPLVGKIVVQLLGRRSSASLMSHCLLYFDWPDVDGLSVFL